MWRGSRAQGRLALVREILRKVFAQDVSDPLRSEISKDSRRNQEVGYTRRESADGCDRARPRRKQRLPGDLPLCAG